MKQFIVLEVCNEGFYIFDTINEAILYAIEKVCNRLKDGDSEMSTEDAAEIIFRIMSTKTDHSFYLGGFFRCYPAQYIKK